MRIPEAVAAYKDEMRSLALAPRTIQNQGYMLDRLVKVAGVLARERGKRKPLDCREIDGQLIVRLFDAYEGIAQGQRNNLLSVLRKFLAYCERERWMEAGETSRLLATRKSKGYQREQKFYIPVTDFQALLNCQDRHPADRAVIALALYTLARKSEIQALTLKDIDFEARTLNVWRQKRKRWTPVGMTPELEAELVRWLTDYAALMGYEKYKHMLWDQPDWHVIPRLVPHLRAPGERNFAATGEYDLDPTCSIVTMEHIVKRALDAIGASTTRTGAKVRHLGEGMHTIRRSGARALFKYLSGKVGKDDALLTVSVMLDHENTAITLRYIGLELQREELNEWLRNTESMYGNPAPALRAVV